MSYWVLSSAGLGILSTGPHETPSVLTVSSAPVYTLGGPDSTSVCASIGGSWNANSYTCTLSADFDLAQNGTLDVLHSASLWITHGVNNALTSFKNEGVIRNNGNITSINGALFEDLGRIDNNGTITAAYSFGNDYGVVNGNLVSAVINNNGTLNINTVGNENAPAGIINNYRRGIINLEQFTGIDTSCVECIDYFTNYGIISNNGTVNTDGFLQNSYYIFNRGTINIGSNGYIDNAYDIAQQTNGKIVNYATINNFGSLYNDHLYCGIDNEGSTLGNGTINNYGMLQNGGYLENYNGTINDYGAGTIRNSSGHVDNWNGAINIRDPSGNFSIFGGFVQNFGLLNNHGSITIYPSMTISGYDPVTGPWSVTSPNDGAIENHDTGTFDNTGTINNGWVLGNRGVFRNYGTINNNGTIYQDYVGNFTNDATGTLNNRGAFRTCPFSIFINPADETTIGRCTPPFQLTSTPPAIGIQTGSTAQVTITLSPDPLYPKSLPPFSGIVMLLVYNIYNQTGITTSFSNPAVSNSHPKSTLTINVSTTVTSWTYPIEIIGTSGSENNTLWIQIGVQSPPPKPPASPTATLEPQQVRGGRYNRSEGSTFYMEASVSARITVPVQITPQNGYDGEVNFTLTSPTPADAAMSCGLDDASVLVRDSPLTDNLTCTSDTAGSYAIQIEAVALIVGQPGQVLLSELIVHFSSPSQTPPTPIFPYFLNLKLVYAMLGAAIFVLIIVVALVFRKKKT